MAVFPITYIAIIIFFIFITYDNKQYWIRAFCRFLGFFLSIEIIINSIVGEAWIYVNETTGTITLEHYNDGFALPLSLFIFALGFYIFYTTIMSMLEGDYKKDGANR